MNERENWLRAVEFRYPEWIPCSGGFSFLTWRTHRQNLEKNVFGSLESIDIFTLAAILKT